MPSKAVTKAPAAKKVAAKKAVVAAPVVKKAAAKKKGSRNTKPRR